MPYKLPLLVEKKLNRLMRKLKLNTGSIDLIKSIDNQYIFLEVNPSGQFGMVEDACNYNLHELVAASLIELSK